LIDNVFLHFLDQEVIQLYSLDRRFESGRISGQFTEAAKYAYIISDRSLIIPLGFYFESAQARDLITKAAPLVSRGDIVFATSEDDISTFVDSKQSQYGTEPDRRPGYFLAKIAGDLAKLHPTTVYRSKSSGEQIRSGWYLTVDAEDPVWRDMLGARKIRFFGKRTMLKGIRRVPEMLGGAAIIWPFVRPHLPLKDLSPSEARLLEQWITKWYIESYLSEYNAKIIIDFPLGDLGCGVQSDACVSLKSLKKSFGYLGIQQVFERLRWNALVELRHSREHLILRSAIFKMQEKQDDLVRAVSGQTFRGLTGSELAKMSQQKLLDLVREGIVSSKGFLGLDSQAIDAGREAALAKPIAIYTSEVYIGGKSVSEYKINFGDNATVHGDVIVAQTIQDSFNKLKDGDANADLKAKLEALHRKVAEMAVNLAGERARETARDLDGFTKEATSGSPRRRWFELNGKSIIEVAQTVGAVGLPVIKLVEEIMKLLP